MLDDLVKELVCVRVCLSVREVMSGMTSGVCVESDLSSMLQRSSAPSHHHPNHHGYSGQGQVSYHSIDNFDIIAINGAFHTVKSRVPLGFIVLGLFHCRTLLNHGAVAWDWLNIGVVLS